MTERRFNKLKLLEDTPYEKRNEENDVVIMPWGGQKGPAHEAYEMMMEQGVPVGWYYTMFISPLNPALLEELRQKELVLVPELNYLGQFSSILRQHGVNARSIKQYTGLPFKVASLVKTVTAEVEAHAASKVGV